MTQTEALKMALEALENWLEFDPKNFGEADKKAITAIREALAGAECDRQPEQCKYGQEPKSCTSSPMDCQCAIDATLAQPEQEPACCNGNCPNTKDCEQAMQCLYTTPPQRTWVGLTDEEYAELAEEFGPFPINQIEAKLKEKNT